MVACCVRNCSNRSTKICEKKRHVERKDRISYHRFPQDPIMYTAWVNALRARKEDWNPTRSSVVCSDHFTYDCFDSSDFQRRLVKQAIPTIFPAIDSERQKSTSRSHRKSSKGAKKTSPANVQMPTFVIIDTASFFSAKTPSSSNEKPTEEKESVHPLPQLIMKPTPSSPKQPYSPPKLIRDRNPVNTYYLRKISILKKQVQNQLKRIVTLRATLNELRKKQKQPKE